MSSNSSVAPEAKRRKPNPTLIGLGPFLVDKRDYYSASHVVNATWESLYNGIPVRYADNRLAMVANRILTVDEENRVVELKLNLREFSGGSFPPQICDFAALQSLTLSQVSNVISLPDGLGNLKSLKTLRILNLQALEQLPVGLGSLVELEKLRITCCTSLTSLPSLGRLTNLVDVNLKACLRLRSLPDCFGKLKNLRTFRAYFRNLTGLPPSFSQLTGLRFLEIGPGPICFDLPREVSEFPELRKVWMSPSCLASFTGNVICPIAMTMKHWIGRNGGSVERSIPHLKRWTNLHTLAMKIGVYEFAGGGLPPLSFGLGYDESLLHIRELNLSFDDRQENSATHIRVSLEELSQFKGLTRMILNGVSLVDKASNSAVESKDEVLFPNLQTIQAQSCQIDEDGMVLIRMPALHRLEFTNSSFGDDGFDYLCSKWLSDSKDLQLLSCATCNISKISDEAVRSLAALNIRSLRFSNNPVQIGTRREIESRLLPLAEACRLLGGGLDKPRVRSKNLHKIMLFNEARSKILNGQDAAPSLWPKLLQNSQHAFDFWMRGTLVKEHSRRSNKLIKDGHILPEADAIYILLRERGVSAVFDGRIFGTDDSG